MTIFSVYGCRSHLEHTIDQVNLGLIPKFARYYILSCNLFKLFKLEFILFKMVVKNAYSVVLLKGLYNTHEVLDTGT